MTHYLVLFVLLPIALAFAGLGFMATALLFYPVGFVAGWALAYLAVGIRRRFGMLAAAPVAVVGFVAAFALLSVAGLVVNGLLLGRSAGSNGAGGLFIGILLGIMLRSRPEGRRGEVSEVRDVRGVRGLRRGLRRWLLGGPFFPKNYAVLGMALFGSLPCLALSLFLFCGVVGPFVFSFLALGLGGLLQGGADTLPIPLRGANAVLRVTGLLCC